MISASVTERLEVGARARLEAGTLRLRRAREGESHVFTVGKVLTPGDEVWLVPLDSRLVFNGIPVAGATTIPGSGVGVAGLTERQTGE